MINTFLQLALALVVWMPATDISGDEVSPSDTLFLEEVTVHGNRISEPRSVQPLQVQRIDSVAIRMSGAVSLAELLERQAGVFVNNYGPAGVNSVSQRGMPSRHTQVMWNGINLNSETLGSCDLSTIPAIMISDVELSSSGSASYGSGAIGGQIQLNSDPATGISASQAVGTTGRRITNVNAGTELGNWKIYGRGMYENSDNDFEYDDPFTPETLTRSNNHVEQVSLGGGLQGRVGDTQIESQLWWLDMDRGVPGPASAPSPRAYQEDRQFQWMTNLTRELTDRLESGATAYVKRQNLDYFNPSSDIESLTQNSEYRLRIPLNWQISPGLRLNIAGESALFRVDSNNFGVEERTLQTAQIDAEWQPHSRLRIYPAVRFDAYNDFGEAWSASLGGNYEVLDDQLFARAYASRDFSAPTFNDLYWPGSGNPDLEPEIAQRMETGLYYQRHGTIAYRFDALAFASRLDDGIEWLPAEGQWEPNNISQINARGVELESTLLTYFQGISVDWTTRYTFTQSLYGEGHANEGNQLRYIPRHNVNTRLNLTRDAFTLSTGWYRVSRRYTSSDNLEMDSADPYHEWDIALARTQHIRGAELELRWNLHNTLNRRYEVVPGYPVPGRRHMFTLSLSL